MCVMYMKLSCIFDLGIALECPYHNYKKSDYVTGVVEIRDKSNHSFIIKSILFVTSHYFCSLLT